MKFIWVAHVNDTAVLSIKETEYDEGIYDTEEQARAAAEKYVASTIDDIDESEIFVFQVYSMTKLVGEQKPTWTTAESYKV